jgi:hypothetical protein
MWRKSLTWLLILLSVFAVPQPSGAEVPTVNLPKDFWRQNRGGSCVHCSAVMLWRWCGHYEWADYWWSKYRGGEWDTRFHERCDAEGVTYCDTYGENDVGFLEWAMRTRRGALVAISNGPLYGYDGRISHAVCLVYMDADVVGILDNNITPMNGPGEVKYVSRAAFLRDWKNSGSWGWTPVANPPAPPQLIQGEHP